MEVLELKQIRNKIIRIYLIDKDSICLSLDHIDILKELVNLHNILIITVEINNENFKEFKNSNLSSVLNALSLEYHLLDIPEYAYGYLFEEISKKEEQIRELLVEYRNMDNKDSFKGLNLKSWIEVLRKELNYDKSILEKKTKPQWIVKKVLDLLKRLEHKEISLIHFFHEKSLPEITKQLRDLHIEVVNYDFKNIYDMQSIIIKQEGNY
ncbi:MAG: hypothetical protein JSV62_10350 [Promethearchaeota archaeon]|nr:MAG: hypothetical protein JSV62_10350 [Candidatus Lokiarchaeota archaeon]